MILSLLQVSRCFPVGNPSTTIVSSASADHDLQHDALCHRITKISERPERQQDELLMDRNPGSGADFAYAEAGLAVQT